MMVTVLIINVYLKQAKFGFICVINIYALMRKYTLKLRIFANMTLAKK